MAFADLSAKADQLQEALWDQSFEDFYREFDDATVALIGNRYRLVGYDTDEEDYSSLTGYEQKLAQTEAGKRLCRLTKAEMLSRIGWAMGITLAFFDLRHEIVHAFLSECGLNECSGETDCWARNETMVDWFARMGERIYRAWEAAGALG